MNSNVIEIMTALFLQGTEFIPKEWELDLPSMYYRHKTKTFTDEVNGVKSEVPYMMSARSVHRMMSAKQ